MPKSHFLCPAGRARYVCQAYDLDAGRALFVYGSDCRQIDGYFAANSGAVIRESNTHLIHSNIHVYNELFDGE